MRTDRKVSRRTHLNVCGDQVFNVWKFCPILCSDADFFLERSYFMVAKHQRASSVGSVQSPQVAVANNWVVLLLSRGGW